MAATSLTCMNLLHLAVTFKVLTLSGSFGSDGGGGPWWLAPEFVY